jgi:NADH:ubiquinone oxidoreductase subunit 6 (subunit J)
MMNAIKVLKIVSLLVLGILTGWLILLAFHAARTVGITGAEFVVVIQILQGNHGAVTGVLTTVGLLFIFILSFLVRKKKPESYLMLTSSIAILLILVMWAAFINPVTLRMTAWTVDTIPGNWEDIQGRWVLYHYIVSVLSGIGFLTLVISSQLDTSNAP